MSERAYSLDLAGKAPVPRDYEGVVTCKECAGCLDELVKLWLDEVFSGAARIHASKLVARCVAEQAFPLGPIKVDQPLTGNSTSLQELKNMLQCSCSTKLVHEQPDLCPTTVM